jgi:hypothetical protein
MNKLHVPVIANLCALSMATQLVVWLQPYEDTLENLTREEIARLACDPDYFTPERITLPEYYTSIQPTQGSAMINEKDVEVTMCTASSSTNLGDKITANGAEYDIKFNDEIVGGLVFNKNDEHIILSS